MPSDLSPKTLLIHVGLPKTGTTTLQAGLFERCPEVEFVGKYSASGNRDSLFGADWMSDFRTILNYGSEFWIGESGPRLAERIRESIEKSEKRALLVSLEGIANPFVDTDYAFTKDIFLKARHLKEVVAPVIGSGIATKILVTVRRQTDLLPSLFSQVFLQGYSCGLFESSYDSFLDFMLGDEITGFGGMLKYDKVMEYYGQLFEPENVFIASMEELFSGEITASVESVADFLAISQRDCLSSIGDKKLNKRKSDNRSKDFRKMMRFSPASHRLEKQFGVSLQRSAFGLRSQLKSLAGVPIYWRLEDRSERISTYYKRSNERLLGLYNIAY